jgi:heme/copper-type cytochrome/quinol oxidase subunit 2
MRPGTSILCFGLFLLASTTPLLSFAAQPTVVELAADGVQRAEIIADSYSYTPDHLIVKANIPVELSLQSKTWLVPHSFVLKDAEAGLDIEQDIPAGKRVLIKFTPTRPGTFTFFCNKKLLFFKSHEDRGMKGTLEVTD